MDRRAKDPFALIKEHILLPFAGALEAADQSMTAAITRDVIKQTLDLVPEDWLHDAKFTSTTEHRQAYVEYLTSRLEAPRNFAAEAIRAQQEAMRA